MKSLLKKTIETLAAAALSATISLATPSEARAQDENTDDFKEFSAYAAKKIEKITGTYSPCPEYLTERYLKYKKAYQHNGWTDEQFKSIIPILYFALKNEHPGDDTLPAGILENQSPELREFPKYTAISLEEGSIATLVDDLIDETCPKAPHKELEDCEKVKTKAYWEAMSILRKDGHPNPGNFQWSSAEGPQPVPTAILLRIPEIMFGYDTVKDNPQQIIVGVGIEYDYGSPLRKHESDEDWSRESEKNPGQIIGTLDLIICPEGSPVCVGPKIGYGKTPGTSQVKYQSIKKGIEEIYEGTAYTFRLQCDLLMLPDRKSDPIGGAISLGVDLIGIDSTVVGRPYPAATENSAEAYRKKEDETYLGISLALQLLVNLNPILLGVEIGGAFNPERDSSAVSMGLNINYLFDLEESKNKN